jgi:hypothetical protein
MWRGADGFTLGMTFPQIVMHAVSKDASAFPRPCIYLQLDDGSEDMVEGSDEEQEEEAHGNGVGAAAAGVSPELRLVPEDSSKGMTATRLFPLLAARASISSHVLNCWLCRFTGLCTALQWKTCSRFCAAAQRSTPIPRMKVRLLPRRPCVPSSHAHIRVHLGKPLCCSEGCVASYPAWPAHAVSDKHARTADEGDFFYNESEVMAGLDDATRATLMAQRIQVCLSAWLCKHDNVDKHVTICMALLDGR